MDIQALHELFLNSSGLTTDTRVVEVGQLFFALKGDSFNGNKFAKDALRKGAKYAIIDEIEYKTNNKYIVVKDVLSCLQQLALFHRKYLNIPIIGITGTNGKTTTKELIQSVLQKKYNVGYTKGNLNNHIGVPLTLLSFSKDTEIGVVEMGANHIGEIAELCKIAAPNYGLITNIGKAHLEGFGSFEGVLKAKSELYDFLRSRNKPVFINGNDNILLNASMGLEKIKYGKEESFFTHTDFVEADPYLVIKWKDRTVNSKLVGGYNMDNILAAICVGMYFGLADDDIVEAISNYVPENNRSQLTKTNKNTLIIDAYNANPTSMDLSIRNFVNVKNENKVLILGDMFELGGNSQEEHKKILDLVKELKFKNVFFVGSEFYSFSGQFDSEFLFFTGTTQLIDHIKEYEITGHTILLKASRGIKLEIVTECL